MRNQNKIVAYFFIPIYYLLVVLPHEEVGKFVVFLFSKTTREVYQKTVLVFGAIIGVSILCIWFRKLLKKVNNMPQIVYAIITLLLMIGALQVLIVHNIEIIHYLQYWVLGVALFKVLQSPFKVMFWGTILAFIDELYQYVYLAPDNTWYFDFNDVVLDQLGLGAGIIIALVVWAFKPISWKGIKIELVFGLGVLVFCVFMFLIGEISVYGIEGDKQPWLVLIKRPEVGFWTQIKHLNVTFHVMRPLEGVISILALIGFYSMLEYFQKEKND